METAAKKWNSALQVMHDVIRGPNGGSGGKFEGRFGEHCCGNGGIGGSMSGVGEGKDESMGGMGGGSLARRSMVSYVAYEECGGFVVSREDPRMKFGAGGGKVKGGGVDLGVSKRLLLLIVGDRCGIEVWEVGVVGGSPET
ncbi:hypothetical protein Tco_0277296 [Tanacetum coccineum]